MFWMGSFLRHGATLKLLELHGNFCERLNKDIASILLIF